MPTVVTRNERSWAIDLISEINAMLQNTTMQIKRAGGESTISTGRNSRMFPDVILYGDELQTNILQGWEIKLPDTLITDEEFIFDAQRKAVSLGLNSCFIWNFTFGVLYVQNEDGIFQIERQWDDTNFIRSRGDVNHYRNEWLNLIREIIIELNQYFLNGEIRASSLGEIISDSVISTIINRNKILVAELLNDTSRTNAVMRASLEVWWTEVQSEYAIDEPNLFSAYSKILLLNWTNRIIFAHLIKRIHNYAVEVENINFETTPEQANHIFNEITSHCDFYNVFNTLDFNTIIPDETWKDIIELSLFLNENGITEIGQTSLQTILERTVSTSKREIVGQFTTPTKLAELLSKITVNDWSKDVIDPCCGTGSIPQAVMKYKKNLYDVQSAIISTWASDKFTFPLQIANMSLISSDSINIPSRTFNHNALNLRSGEIINITNPNDGSVMQLQLPLFGSVISNLPFVHFEVLSSDDQSFINNIINTVERSTRVRLNARSDLYSYLVFSIWNILEPNGTLGIITSNSWLGTEAGRNYFNALTQYFKVKQIHISNAGRWFKNADVVTTITILTKRDRITRANNEEITNFCMWNKSLEELTENEEMSSTLINSSILNRELERNVIQLKSYSYNQIQEFLSMKLSLNALFHNIGWLLDIKNNLIKITEKFNLIRGERRGWDPMFYPEDGHNIERRYIRNVLKTARNIATLHANAQDEAFCCSESIAELERRNHIGALSWIRRFENLTNGVGRPLPVVLSRTNLYWYEMSSDSLADIVTSMNPDRRLFYSKFDEPTFINQRLIGLRRINDDVDMELCHALLNSMIGMFYIEAVGFGRGLGVLDINKASIERGMMMNPDLVSTENRENILEKFRIIANRQIRNTDEELINADRIDFEHAVLQAFNMDNHFEAIKQSLLSMQSTRRSVRN